MIFGSGLEYGELQSNGTVDTAKNTGNIAKQTLSFNGAAHPLVQSYKYDALYRITEATETANSVANWFQVWGYDRYGNRTSFNQNIGGNPASVNPTIDVNTNRFNASQGFAYDKNGNVTSNVDPITSLNRTFLFNGDNKQYEVKDANGTTTARYYYDGEGKRVKKKNEITGETTIFVYSSGKLVAEYSTVTPPATPTVNYATTDHLGSPRVITDAIGQVTSRRDFLPFGEEVTINVGARSTALKYGSSDDKVRQKFTGYQKDTETSLDFAEARMYDNRFGRFTAVDPLLASGKSANPQTFNRYVYVANRPLQLTDPDGLDPWWRGNCNAGRCQYVEAKEKPNEGVWNEVRFNNFGYTTVGEWGRKDGPTAFLYATGGQDDGQRAERIYNTIQSIMNLDFSSNSPKFLAIRNPQVRDAASDVIGGFAAFGINSASDTYNFGVGVTNWAAGSEQLPYAWRYTPEQPGQRLFYYSANVASVGRIGFGLYNGIQTVRSGGLSFSAYKAANGGTETLGYINTVNKQGVQVTQRISTGFSHMFITQRMQRAANLPNWLVNNRINVVKLNTIQHSLVDRYRFQFLRNGMKSQVCWTCEYNWFTKIGK